MTARPVTRDGGWRSAPTIPNANSASTSSAMAVSDVRPVIDRHPQRGVPEGDDEHERDGEDRVASHG